MQAQQAGIHLGKEVLSQEAVQPEREQAKGQKENHEDAAMLEGGFQQLLVAAAEVFKLALKASLEAAQKALWRFGAMLVAAHDVHDQGGDQRPGEQIARQHGEAYSLRQRHEQELGHARQEEHGHENDTDTERGDESRHGDLLRAVKDSLLHFLAHGKVALDVFDFHRGVIHQDAHGQRQSSQSHDVDGLADGAQQDDRNKNGKRDGNGYDDRWAPITEENEDHDSGEGRRDQPLPQHSLDRCPHKQRLVEQRGNFQFRRQRLSGLLNDVLDPGDNLQRRRVAVLINRHQRAPVPILAHDVGLGREAVANVGNIAHVKRGSVAGLNRKVVQFRDGLRRSIHLYAVFQRA